MFLRLCVLRQHLRPQGHAAPASKLLRPFPTVNEFWLVPGVSHEMALELVYGANFCFWFGPGVSHEMALELVYGANFRCGLHHISSLTRLKGSWGQLWSKTNPKRPKTKTKMIIFPRGGGRSRPHFARPSRAPGAGQSSKVHPPKTRPDCFQVHNPMNL
jgi:hypothetical protein